MRDLFVAKGAEYMRDRFGEDAPTIETPEGDATLDQCFRLPTTPALTGVVFINAYAGRRWYGGPEEGGWWYDVGEPLASVPMLVPSEYDPETGTKYLSDYEPVQRERDRVRAVFASAMEHQSDRFSAACDGDDLVVSIESSMAAAYPAETPHYE